MTQFSKMQHRWIALLCLCVSSVWAEGAYTLQGDLGAAVYRTPAITRTTNSSTALLPYAYADYGPFYARINTLGYKAMSLGAGHLELATRVTLEGYKSAQAGIGDRTSPLPIGLGTFQKTDYGAFFAYSFYDSTSGGHLLDLMYAAKFHVAGVHFYPQVGVERRSAKYVQHLYGVSAAEATASGLTAYSAQSSVSPNMGLTAEYPLAKNLNLTYQVRKKWLDGGISNSPLVTSKHQTSSFLALTHNFH